MVSGLLSITLMQDEKQLFTVSCKHYLEELARIHNSGNATEPSYYPALKDLFQAFVNHRNLNYQVIVAPKKTENGMPDLLLKSDMMLLGYLEAKDISVKLADIEETEQIKRYMEVFPNLVLTDFFTFWLCRNGKKISSVALADKKELLVSRNLPRATNLKEFENLLYLFCSFAPIFSVNARQLATELAIRAKQLGMIISDETLDKNHILEPIYKVLRDHLISSLTYKSFADIYS
jgi:hypothetical protein